MNKLMKLFSFTKSETKVILFIVSVIITGYTIKHYKQIISGDNITPYDFSGSDSVFFKRSGIPGKNGKQLTDTSGSGYDSVLNLSAADDTLNKSNKQDGIKDPESNDGKIININTADKDDLVELPGIGESTADRIISYRNEKKGFRKTEELMNVSGIGRKKFDKIKSYIKAE